MGIAKLFSAQLVGLKAEIITIEVDISKGLHAFSIVGMGDRSVEEAKDRISAAIKNTGFTSPKQKNQKVIISLAPAQLRKEGPSFDLGMALCYLKSAEEIDFDYKGKLFLGELTLEGNINRVSGILPILCQAKNMGFTEAFIPEENAEEASLAEDVDVYPVSSLDQLINHLTGIMPVQKNIRSQIETKTIFDYDMSIVCGNETAKRGLEIAASGAHNVIMCGSPGTGKTLLAQCFSSILPELSYEQAVEVTGIHSIAHTLEKGLISRPPFRAPHHTASYPSIVGGGSIPKPGEITLAHRGVLFMDEFPEFDRSVIEALRQPLEDKLVTVSRSRGVVTFPAQCILIASMNPCPCGKGKDNDCTCSPSAITSYKKKISAPILDRIDIWLNVNKIDYEKLGSISSNYEKSETIRNRVINARKIQEERFQQVGIQKHYNSEISAKDLEQVANIDNEAKQILTISAKKMSLSGRAFHRTIKVARTIADLDNSETINKKHILEALQYRSRMAF